MMMMMMNTPKKNYFGNNFISYRICVCVQLIILLLSRTVKKLNMEVNCPVLNQKSSAITVVNVVALPHQAMLNQLRSVQWSRQTAMRRIKCRLQWKTHEKSSNCQQFHQCCCRIALQTKVFGLYCWCGNAHNSSYILPALSAVDLAILWASLLFD